MAVRRTATGWMFVLATLAAAPGCGDTPTGSSALMDDELRLSVTSATLRPGETVRIEAAAASVVTWESSDPSVVAVSPAGVVEARKTGAAEVTARARGKKRKVKVEVTDPAPAPTDPAPTDPADPADPEPTDPAPTPTEPANGSTLVYGHDFDDGTTGAFGQWGGYTPRPVSVLADPTGSGRGKVAKVVYERDPAAGGSVDVNGGMYYRPNPAGGHASGVGFGETIYFRADLWLPRYPGGRPARPQYDQRKLLYLKFGDPAGRTGSVILNSWGRADGSGLDLALGTESSAAPSEVDYGIGALPWETWHKLEVLLIANDRGQSNGVVQVWLNGRLVKERRNALLFSASPSPATDFIYEWGIGNQEQWAADEKVAMKNYRLWDNVEFRTGKP